MNTVHAGLTLQHCETWQEQLQNAIRDPRELADFLRIPLAELGYAEAADRSFPLLVPRAFASRMQRGNPQDPLLRQILAAGEETHEVAGFTADPLAEVSEYGGKPGVLQKYSGRALFVATGHCAINCRYCFRRHFPYAQNAQSSEQRMQAVDALLDDPAIRELILSGGDPLLLPDAQIAAISERMQRRPGVTLRIHTRLPVVIPDRVTEGFLEIAADSANPVVIVLHANHPKEIDRAVTSAISRMRDAGATVLNQSVLLAGINDSAAVLAALSDQLFAAGALPYYLHMLDRVAGAAHFAVPERRARRLVGELASMRPGYLVPKLAVELPGAGSKREIAPDYTDAS